MFEYISCLENRDNTTLKNYMINRYGKNYDYISPTKKLQLITKLSSDLEINKDTISHTIPLIDLSLSITIDDSDHKLIIKTPHMNEIRTYKYEYESYYDLITSYLLIINYHKTILYACIEYYTTKTCKTIDELKDIIRTSIVSETVNNHKLKLCEIVLHAYLAVLDSLKNIKLSELYNMCNKILKRS